MRRATPALLLLACVYSAPAQEFPSRPVQLVIPFATGGSTDQVFRIFAPTLSERLGQPAIIVNRAGGMGSIGMAVVAKAPANGYTLGVATLSFAANPLFLEGRLPFDTQRDFASIVQVSRAPLVLTVNPDIGVRNVKELIALAQAKPGVLNYGSSGIASSGHLAGALFALTARVKMMHIPFSGTTSAVNVASGSTQLQIAAIPASLGFIKSGRVLPLGVTAAKPVAMLPGVPTIAEAGLAGFEMYEWSGVLAPVGTPGAVIRRLHADIAHSITQPSVKAKIEAVGVEVAAGTPEDLAAHLKREFVVWSKVAAEVRDAPSASR